MMGTEQRSDREEYEAEKAHAERALERLARRLRVAFDEMNATMDSYEEEVSGEHDIPRPIDGR